MGADILFLTGAVAKHGAKILLQLGVSEQFAEELGSILSNPEEVKVQYALEHNVVPLEFEDT